MKVPEMNFEQKKTLVSNVAELCFLFACAGFIAGLAFMIAASP